MIEIWPQVINLAEKTIDKFSNCTKLSLPETYHYNHDGISWQNFLWSSSAFRRAHIELLDARESKKMWVMHMTIFPYFNCPDPIFGFDVVCGKNKITGAFHDFSKVGESYLYDWYQEKMSTINWDKPRKLPEWAENIFSPQMVAAGNIQTQEEMNKLCEVFIDNLDCYLYNVGKVEDNKDYTKEHNFYCVNQKLNPHTPGMMESFGIDKTIFRKFMDDVLFPEN
jgi:phycocyanobilin:ferredoxin oxidoreductase